MIDLYPNLFRKTWSRRRMADEIAAIEVVAVKEEYDRLRSSAPRRASYFVGHSGVPSSSGWTNRREEHVAIALAGLDVQWPLGDGSLVRFLDYQVPLKSRRADLGIGKIDLLGLSETGRLVVTELKVVGESGGNSDAPVTALMEALRYAAIVQANQQTIADEIGSLLGLLVSPEPPLLLILGERAWWDRWSCGITTAGLAERIGAELGLSIEFASLEGLNLAYGLDGEKPRLDPPPQLTPWTPQARA